MFKSRWLAAAAVALTLAAASSASAADLGPVRTAVLASTTTLQPVDNTQVIYDTLGQRIDAHDGSLLQTSDGTIYLYGTAYGCGFLLNQASPYCGVRVYKTNDLRVFTPAGAVGGLYAFNHLDGDWQTRCTAPNFGCYRPHVVRRPSDGRYVMWLNISGDAGYRILTSASPAGPFTDTGVVPNLAVKPATGGIRYGDEDVTVAPDGRGYVTYTAIDPATNSHTLVIEQLDSTLTTGTGRYTVLDAMPNQQEMVEAPGLFYGPNSAWYLVFSDPARPYATTGAGIMNGPTNTADPLGGAWTDPRLLNSDSCSGQPTGVWHVDNTWVFGSDRWVSGDANQAQANNYYGSLTFTANGGTAIDAYTCQSTWTLQ